MIKSVLQHYVLISIAAAVALLASGTKLVGYAKVAAAAGSRVVEDQLPFDWKVDLERARIDEMAMRRQRVVLSREQLVKARETMAQALAAEGTEVGRLQEASGALQVIVKDLRAHGEGARVVAGRAVSIADLEAQSATVRTALARAQERRDQAQRKLATVDDDVTALDGDLRQLATAEAEWKGRLASSVRDQAVLDARLAAARQRLDARVPEPGEHAGAIAREIDDLSVELAVAEEKLGPASPAQPSYVVSLDDVNAEAARIAAGK